MDTQVKRPTAKLRINVNNTEEVKNLLTRVQHRCRERLLTVEKVRALAMRAEWKLNLIGLPKKYRAGNRYTYQERFAKPNCYNGVPSSTYICIERGGKDWFITLCFRASCSHSSNMDLSTMEFNDVAKGYAMDYVREV